MAAALRSAAECYLCTLSVAADAAARRALFSQAESLLAAAAEAAPGWASRYGGPEGVAQLTSALHDHLAQLTKTNAELRAATVVYLRTHPGLSLLTIARLLGVTKGAVQHVMRRAQEDSTRGSGTFARLETPGAWRS